MANNKTTWKTGNSGNPAGRPPKSRALTDTLAAAGRAKVMDADGKPVARSKLLSEMIWTLIIAGQLQFLASNRNDENRRGDVQFEIKPGDWFEIVKWLFKQVDGDFALIWQTETDDGDDAAVETEPILYIPDNGRQNRNADQTPDAQPPTESGAIALENAAIEPGRADSHADAP